MQVFCLIKAILRSANKIAISSVLQASVSPRVSVPEECGMVRPLLSARGGHARPRDPEPGAGGAAETSAGVLFGFHLRPV